jgi:hypothetical protein
MSASGKKVRAFSQSRTQKARQAASNFCLSGQFVAVEYADVSAAPKNNCGSELARDEGFTFNISVD